MSSRYSRIASVLFLFFIVLLLRTGVTAQEATGKIVGQVTDPQGAVIADAKVTVTNVATRIAQQVVTDKDGIYQALHLAIGSYTVAAEHSGFRKIVTEAHSLEINQSLRVDVTLQVGAATETVEVSGDATLVETYNPTLGNSVTSRPIVNLPLNGRNVLDLAKLEPGVTDENPGHDGKGSFSIAGGRLDSVTYLLDGGVNNDLLWNEAVWNPNPDTVAEFRILESNYSAEYGRNGGGVISVVTKSGTNSLHGSVFDFLRNDALNANTFFNNRNGLPREVLKRNQFGGTLGGPIKKDKAFFFFGYQGQRQTQQQNPGAQLGFTSREITGDFSQSQYTAFTEKNPADPNPCGGTGEPACLPQVPVTAQTAVTRFLQAHPYFQPNAALAAQGIIDPARINPVSQKFIAAGIIPSSPTGVILTQGTAKTDNDEWTGKLDYNITSNDRLAATVGAGRAPQLCPYAFDSCDSIGTSTPFPVTSNNHRYFLNLAYTKTFSATVLNEARITAQRVNVLQFQPAKKLPTVNDLGIGTTPDQLIGPPILYFYDSELNLGFSYRGPTSMINNTFGFSDTLSWVKGKHNVKLGINYTPFQNNTLYDYFVNGEFDFYGSSGAGTGAEFADFLLGIPDEYYQWPSAPSNIRTKSTNVFIQDEWRATHNLVLNFGLRYEYSTPKLDTLGRSFTIVPGAQSSRFLNAPPGLLFPGDPGVPMGANYPDRNDFAPRFGFAWNPDGKGHTSIRGGVGVFYDILKGEDNLQFNGQPPFFGYTDLYFVDLGPPAGTSDVPYFTDPFGSTGMANPFPSKPPAPNIDFDAAGFLPFGGGGVYFVDPHLRTPYIYQYNLSVQRELSSSLKAEIAYVGSSGHKLTSLVDMNPFILGTATRVLNAQPGALSYSWSTAMEFRNTSDQSYNSLQTSLKKQLTSHGKLGSTYFTLGYTWAKGLDNASGFRQDNDSVPYYNPGQFHAVSDIDITHRVTFSGGWDLPFAQLWNSGPKPLTQGWSLYPILSFRTGFPVDIRVPGFRNDRRIPGPSGAGDAGLVRVNLVGSSVTTFDPKAKTDPNTLGAVYFDPSNFEWASLEALYGRNLVPAANERTYGTLPRNFFRAPGRSNLDLAVAKTTSFGERMKLEFRGEFFNILNTAQFMAPNTAGNSSLFGEITRTFDPRIIQLGARITF